MTALDLPVVGLAVGGALCGAGIACAAYTASLVRWEQYTAPMTEHAGSALARGRLLRAAAAATAGTGVGVVTGWPVGAVLAGAAAWWLPRLLGPDTAGQEEAARVEAVASWSEQLRDMITGAAGLHQAITATAAVAPAPIRSQAAELDTRLRSGQRMDQATAGFARDANCDVADLVAAALVMGASRQAGDLAGLLGRLAEAARDRATVLARVSASRARVRSSVRIITAATLLMLIGMTAFNATFLTPLGTLTGQTVLAAVGAVWAASFAWLARLSRPPKQPRLFVPVPDGADSPGRPVTAEVVR